jgi:hypothetical protein
MIIVSAGLSLPVRICQMDSDGAQSSNLNGRDGQAAAGGGPGPGMGVKKQSFNLCRIQVTAPDRRVTARRPLKSPNFKFPVRSRGRGGSPAGHWRHPSLFTGLSLMGP